MQFWGLWLFSAEWVWDMVSLYPGLFCIARLWSPKRYVSCCFVFVIFRAPPKSRKIMKIMELCCFGVFGRSLPSGSGIWFCYTLVYFALHGYGPPSVIFLRLFVILWGVGASLVLGIRRVCYEYTKITSFVYIGIGHG